MFRLGSTKDIQWGHVQTVRTTLDVWVMELIKKVGSRVYKLRYDGEDRIVKRLRTCRYLGHDVLQKEP